MPQLHNKQLNMGDLFIFKSLYTWELKKVLKAWSGNDESVPYALAYGSLSRGSDFAHLMDIICRNNLSNRRDQVWQFIAERILMELKI